MAGMSNSQDVMTLFRRFQSELGALGRCRMEVEDPAGAGDGALTLHFEEAGGPFRESRRVELVHLAHGDADQIARSIAVQIAYHLQLDKGT